MANIYRSVKVPKNEIDTILTVDSLPTKTVYQIGESLDITGLVVTADINGMTCDVTNRCSYSPSSFEEGGTKTITAMYNGYTATFDVVVEGYGGIKITTLPRQYYQANRDSMNISGMVVTADYGTYTEVVSSSEYTTVPAPNTILTVEDTMLTVTYNGKSTSIPLYVYGNLGETSWQTIQAVAASGKSNQVWSIGDRKSVTLNGRTGSYLSFSNDSRYYVFIMHFNYRSENGILFGCFKRYDEANSAWRDVIILDGQGSPSNGDKVLNYNHWGNYNGGGWKGCDARYDILGSTDVPPSGYGGIAGYGRVGYDATETCATNPVPNTLMSCLPADLRAVMAPLTIYTDNSSYFKYSMTKHDLASYVTASIDYLPMLSEYELYGSITKGNTYEQSYQSRPSYYSGAYYGGAITTYKCNKDGTLTTSYFGQRSRSPEKGTGTSQFVGINSGGAPAVYGASGSASLTFTMFRVA